MTSPRAVFVATLAAILAAPTLAADEPVQESIRLRNGAMVSGEILRKKSDRIVIDLGFTVLSIPTEEVERIITEEQPARAAIETGNLYSVDPGREELTVKENVDRCGEAVLEVRTPTGLGSGFVIHPDGYVVTAHHVIAGEHDISLTLFDRRDQELDRVRFGNVRVVALNPHLDLALLKIDDAGDRSLPSIPLGDSDRLRQGQTVFTIGSALGLDRTVSQGIVSLKNRPLEGHLFIQSTVQINPGNSGGPLFDLRGTVVGVINMKIGAVGIEGLSFAVPVSALREFLRHRDAFAFDPTNPNAGFRYYRPSGNPVGDDEPGGDS